MESTELGQSAHLDCADASCSGCSSGGSYNLWTPGHLQGKRSIDRSFLRRAAVVAATAAIGVKLLSLDQLSVGVTCPFRRITGVPCPFCGSTTAMAALAGGNLGKAVIASPLVALLVFVLFSSFLPSAWTTPAVAFLQRKLAVVGVRQRALMAFAVVGVFWLWQLIARSRFGVI